MLSNRQNKHSADLESLPILHQLMMEFNHIYIYFFIGGIFFSFGCFDRKCSVLVGERQKEFLVSCEFMVGANERVGI